jgi:hypothetical protein
MTISQPSKLAYVVEVPKVKNLTATFKYNFFTPDECVNDSGGVPAEALSRPASNIDADFIQWSLTRVPREVDFTFSLPKIADIGNNVSSLSQRNNSNRTTGAQYGSLIQDNIDKIVDEDYFGVDGYVAVGFHDGEIDDKVHYLVSGTLATATLENESADSTSTYRAAMRLVVTLPVSIQPHFVFRALTQHTQAYGAQFYTPPRRTTNITLRIPAPLSRPRNQSRVLNNYFERLKKVNTNAQINSKLFQDLVNKTISDPTSTMAADVANMHNFAKQAKQAVNQRFSPSVAESDYKTFLPYVSVKRQSTSAHHDKYTAEVVGFIIDKVEVKADGTTVNCDPIIIESPYVAQSADFKVKFHTRYQYQIRTIAQLTLPAIDENNGDVATVKVLVSSKPSHKIYVGTTVLDPPPPPGDIDFLWNYGTNQLTVVWAFPVWSQRDVKQFQVFRRDNVNHPFQLQKQYNFDDSVVKFPDYENPDPKLVEVLKSPCQFYTDVDFNWKTQITPDKGFIYTVACIDAHGQTSPLAAQYRVWWDPFKNQLQVEHVSHLGAPKPYPNLYLDGDVFSNTIKVNGPQSTTCKLYFNPEYYYLYDDENRLESVVATKQKGGSYKLQFINLDNGKSQDIDIFIDDQLKTGSPRKLSIPSVLLGPKRRNIALQLRPT